MENYHDELRVDQESGDVRDIPTRLQGRRYAFISYQDDDTVKAMHIGSSFLRNLADESYFATINGLYHLSPISSVELNTMLFKGPEQSEFGAMPFPRAFHVVFRGKF